MSDLYYLKEHTPPTLTECSTKNLLYLLKYQTKNENVKQFQEHILSYIEENEINGHTLQETKSDQFGKNVIKFYGHNKIYMAAMETFNFFITYPFDIYSEVQCELAKLLMINKQHDDKQTVYKSPNDLLHIPESECYYQTCESKKRISVIFNGYKKIKQLKLSNTISFSHMFTFKDIYTLQQIQHDFAHIQK
eukprot:5293_1